MSAFEIISFARFLNGGDSFGFSCYSSGITNGRAGAADAAAARGTGSRSAGRGVPAAQGRAGAGVPRDRPVASAGLQRNRSLGSTEHSNQSIKTNKLVAEIIPGDCSGEKGQKEKKEQKSPVLWLLNMFLTFLGSNSLVVKTSSKLGH